MAFQIKRGDLLPILSVVLAQSNGNPIPLGTAVGIRAIVRQNGRIIVSRPATIVDAAGGEVALEWEDGDTDVAGLAEVEFEIIWPTLAPQTVPSAGGFEVQIIADLDGPATLLTLGEYRALAGIDPTDTRDDLKVQNLLGAASQAITNYTERDFLQLPITEERTFEYDGSGYLDIDDAASVSSVSLVIPHGTDMVLTSDDWVAQPARRDDSPVYYYLSLPGYTGAAWGDPAMGFTRNLDVYAAEGRLRAAPQTVKVTASWGWPFIPSDVKLAAFWTVQEWVSKPSGEGLTAEAIEGFSRSWGGRANAMIASLAVPNRARDLLASYQRIYV